MTMRGSRICWKPKSTISRNLPDVGMVHSDFQTIDPAGNIVEESVARRRNRQRPSGHVFRELFMDSFIVAISVLVRKECFDRLGSWDEKLRWGDYHMWLRIARHYKVDYIPEVLVKYRQHPGQNTRPADNGLMEEDLVQISVLKDILERYPEVRLTGEEAIRRRLAEVYFGGAYYYFDHGMFEYAHVPGPGDSVVAHQLAVSPHVRGHPARAYPRHSRAQVLALGTVVIVSRQPAPRPVAGPDSRAELKVGS